MKKLLIIIVSCLSLLIAGTVELTSVRAKTPSTMTELKTSVEKYLIDLDKTFTIK